MSSVLKSIIWKVVGTKRRASICIPQPVRATELSNCRTNSEEQYICCRCMMRKPLHLMCPQSWAERGLQASWSTEVSYIKILVHAYLKTWMCIACRSASLSSTSHKAHSLELFEEASYNLGLQAALHSQVG